MKNLKVKYRKSYKAALREELLGKFEQKRSFWGVVLKYSLVPVLVLGVFGYSSLSGFDSDGFLEKAYAAQLLLIEGLEDEILYFEESYGDSKNEYWFSPAGDKLKKAGDHIELSLVEGDRYFYKDNMQCFEGLGEAMVEIDCSESDLKFQMLGVDKDMEVSFSEIIYGDSKEVKDFAEVFYSLDEEFYLTSFEERESFLNVDVMEYEDEVVLDGVAYRTYLLKEPEHLDKPKEYAAYIRFYFDSEDYTLSRIERLSDVDGEFVVDSYSEYGGFEFIPMSEYEEIFDPEKYGLVESVMEDGNFAEEVEFELEPFDGVEKEERFFYEEDDIDSDEYEGVMGEVLFMEDGEVVMPSEGLAFDFGGAERYVNGGVSFGPLGVVPESPTDVLWKENYYKLSIVDRRDFEDMDGLKVNSRRVKGYDVITWVVGGMCEERYFEIIGTENNIRFYSSGCHTESAEEDFEYFESVIQE